MKIEQITLHSYSLPYRQTVRWSDIEESHADYVLLRIVGDDGAVGYAEATAKPTWSGYTPALLIETLRELFLPLLRSCDPAVPSTWLHRVQHIPGHAQAKGLVESALWSLRQPAAPARTVALSCTLTRQAPLAMAEQAMEVSRTWGIGWFKLKGGQGLETDLTAVHALRTALPQAKVYVDANSAYEPQQLARYSAALADHGVTLLEDPCPLSPASISHAARQSRVPLLVDLAARDADTAAHCARHGAAAISAKPGRYGIPEALRVAAAARAAGKPVCIGLFGESELGSLLNLATCGELPAADLIAPAELSFFLGLRESVLARPLVIEQGSLHLPGGRLRDEDIDFSRMQSHACV